IQGIASTVYGANPVLVTTLLEQRRFAGWGVLAIAVGVGLQLCRGRLRKKAHLGTCSGKQRPRLRYPRKTSSILRSYEGAWSRTSCWLDRARSRFVVPSRPRGAWIPVGIFSSCTS